MAKQSGLGDNLYVGGYDLSGDINSLGRIGGGPGVLEVTGIDKLAYERIGGLRDGSMEFLAYFNDAAGQAHPVLRALPVADTVLTYCRGTGLGAPAAALNAKQVNYDPTRDQAGNLRFAVQALANGYGLEWGSQLTAGKRSDGAAANGAGVDLTTVSTAFGLQAYLQVFALTGTSVTVKIQDSADNATWADLAGASFAAAAGPGAQRIAVAGTVRRYLRAVSSGTFTAAVFSLVAVRNETAVTF